MPDPIEGARCPGCGKLVHDGSCVRHNDSYPTLTCNCDCFPGPHEPRSCAQFTGYHEPAGLSVELADEVAALRAERDRYRDALEVITRRGTKHYTESMVARIALAGGDIREAPRAR